MPRPYVRMRRVGRGACCRERKHGTRRGRVGPACGLACRGEACLAPTFGCGAWGAAHAVAQHRVVGLDAAPGVVEPQVPGGGPLLGRRAPAEFGDPADLFKRQAENGLAVRLQRLDAPLGGGRVGRDGLLRQRTDLRSLLRRERLGPKRRSRNRTEYDQNRHLPRDSLEHAQFLTAGIGAQHPSMHRSPYLIKPGSIHGEGVKGR